jgi:hypothetical protein
MSVNGQTVADIAVPGTKLAREATELVRGAITDPIYHHSRLGLLVGQPARPQPGPQLRPGIALHRGDGPASLAALHGRRSS